MNDIFYDNEDGKIQGGGTEKIRLEMLVELLPKAQREKIFSGYDAKSLAVIFEDREMMRTAKAFLSCGMNVSETARILYMHRNTLMYRLNSIKRRTGLDLKDFDAAVTFEVLHILYLLK